MAQSANHEERFQARESGYRWLAEFYDAFFAPFAQPMNKARVKILGGILKHVDTACDLACGTGTAALALARRGIRVYAVDLSAGMCRVTRRKARAANAAVDVIRADMRSFRLPESVDLVMCEGDALNHVSRKQDLRPVAQAVFRALRPGGCFYFDVNNSLGFQRYWKGLVWVERPGVVMVMRNRHSPDGLRAFSDIEYFIRSGRAWVRRQEQVREVCWTSSEIEEALTAAGFESIREWDATPFFGAKSPVGPGCRSVYLAQKPAK
ncbi:class I SAM-dependent DNA methyltransferase [Occallatibacter riparius]|uniref:Class I SAM-dependent methyltransferase n=1 Tax=Occallatibacter riparius TaxID=1002689 RepID=A0A9J7BQQ0_9BACT|nr:class I SAM-dependent methyltransferase [Occallatibacter riparius]UWZ83270.1 class I SAM-dependent methyltransferase [Occallatibacter riparius]